MTDRELLEENNKMLKEILSFVRKVDSAEYRDHQDFMEFLRNVAADIWVEYTEPEQRGRLFNLINKGDYIQLYTTTKKIIIDQHILQPHNNIHKNVVMGLFAFPNIYIFALTY